MKQCLVKLNALITDKSEEADPSKVTLTIEKGGDGSIVTLTHEMAREWMEFVPQTERGWGRMLQAIDELLACS